MPFPGPEMLVLFWFGVLVVAVAGGYGGARLRTRELARDLDVMASDLPAFDLRIKKLEGRSTREVQAQQGTKQEQLVRQLAELASAQKKQRQPAYVAPAQSDGQPEDEDDVLRKLGWRK